MMAEMESWEAAAEFGIPEAAWASYQVRERSDDLYIACLASIFDAMRVDEGDAREEELASLAKTLVIYSRSAAARYLEGVERQLNQLYCAALYYMAGFPATAALLARHLRRTPDLLEEEKFLLGFLGRSLRRSNPLEGTLSDIIRMDATSALADLVDSLDDRVISGLREDPRKFISAKLASSCMERFSSTNVWDALRANAAHYSTPLWQPFLGNDGAFKLWELLPSQLNAVRAGLLGDDDETFSLQMPTSAGKTALCELLIYHEVKARERCVLFLVPFRALAAEIRDGMTRRLDRAGVSVVASHGGNIPTRSESATVQDTDVLITTPEKFTALTQVVPELEDRFQTIICDEGQLIDDTGRGLQYELLLTKLRGTLACRRKVVFISAILPNMDELHQWLGGEPNRLARSDYRPVETDYAFLLKEPRTRNTWRLSFNPTQPRPRNFFLIRFLEQNDFRYLNPATGRPKLIAGWDSYLSLACATALKARRNGAVALFTTTRGGHGIAGLGDRLLALCELDARVAQGSPPTSSQLPELQEFIEFLLGEDCMLARLLKYGVGLHHGQLPQEIRRAMEEALQKDLISILLCTTTLAEGVNLPIRTLVVHTVRRYNVSRQQWQPLPRRSIKNVIGRAGRAGKETRGRVVFVTDTEKALVEQVLRDERMESAHGALYRLISAINQFVLQHRVPLENEFLDRQTDPTFLAMIDSIDFTLLDLIPPDTPQDDLEQHVDELVERTLASQYCSTPALHDCLRTLFRLRAEKLKESVRLEDWPRLRKSGASSRFWTFVSESQLIEHQLWTDLMEPLDDEWLKNVILRLLEFPSVDIETSQEIMREAIVGWMSGLTYVELANRCSCDIDKVLEIVCNHLGYQLQDHVAKLCQLALDSHGEETVSEVARNWASLLQYGLGSLQQLDLFERGATDRIAVWGVSRILVRERIDLRGNDLVRFARTNGEAIRTALTDDARVPRMSVSRLCDELRLPR